MSFDRAVPVRSELQIRILANDGLRKTWVKTIKNPTPLQNIHTGYPVKILNLNDRLWRTIWTAFSNFFFVEQ
ncbi:MAG: hypothetical protein D6728_16250 [Cyanobacteria bacterium J055]|nr:MAG: hypothetical protein D6728_16250 [Cyanobacteria bacterium J055]